MNTATSFWDAEYVAFVAAVTAQEARDYSSLLASGDCTPGDVPLPPEPENEEAA